MTDHASRRRNLLTGWLVLGLAFAAGAWVLLGWLLRAAPAPEQTYVAYFENAGGLRAGDRVRTKGRSAGRVTDVRIVQHEGRTVARVEFAIAPGEGSQWLKETNLPVDTELRIQKPRLMGNTQLSISPGSSKQTIADGGEVKRTVSDTGQDQLSQFKQELAKIQGYVDQGLTLLDGPLLEQITSGLAELQRRAAQFEEMLAKGMDFATTIAPRLQEATDMLNDLRKQLEGNSAEVSGNISKLGDNAAQADKAVAELSEKLAGYADAVAEVDHSIAGLRRQMESQAVTDAGKSLRRLSAQVRESMRVAVSNPAAFGDMPPWRKLRKHYHGDTFKPGDGTEKYEND